MFSRLLDFFRLKNRLISAIRYFSRFFFGKNMIKNIRIRSVSRGNSFFEFIAEFCLDEKDGDSVNRAFHRLCTMMRKMDVRSAIIEELSPSFQDINAECAALSAYYGVSVDIKAHRFTFIAEEISTLGQIPALDKKKFLASAILINFEDPTDKKWHSYIFSAIVTIPRIVNHEKFGDIALLNNYLHIYKKFSCDVSVAAGTLHRFVITGTFFCQQNTFTSVCAHASLCMTLNNMTLKDVGIVAPEDINRILGIDHKKKKTEAGLSKDDITTVLQRFNLTLTWTNFFDDPNVDYNEYIYKYLESRCPVLLVFTTADPVMHVVPVLGHTLNSDMWRPEAEPMYGAKGNRLNYRSASAWVDHFIIHDDNFGMYFCVPVDALKRVTLPKHDPAFRAHFAVVVIPSDVTTPAWEAEWASVFIVKEIISKNLPVDKWSDRIVTSDPPINRPVVARTLLCERQAYLKSLDIKDFEGTSFSEKDKEELTADLPDRFWLSEISLPDLYTANKSKIVDVFYKADCPSLPVSNREIHSRWLQIRFPNALLKRKPDGSLAISEMSVKSHYPLLRLERENDLLDW